jgi:hypothetical protein
MTQLGCQGNSPDEALAGFGEDYIKQDQLGKVKGCLEGKKSWGCHLFSFQDEDMVVAFGSGYHQTPRLAISI